jgi:adenylate cyclase
MAPKFSITHTTTGARSEFALDRDEVRIGRALMINDLVLDNERVSRKHALLKRAGRSYLLTDLDSANGTFVNDERIKERLLNDKDAVRIGDYTLVYEDPGGQPAIQYEDRGIGSTIMLRNPAQVALSAELINATRSSGPDARVKTSSEDLETLRRKAEALSRLYELSQILSSVFSLKDIFKKVSEMLFRTTPADRFVVLLKSASSDELAPFATEFRGGSKGGDKITISRTILNRVLSERVSLLSLDAQSDERLEGAVSIVMQQVRSVMCAPLLGKDGVLGVIYVDCQQQMKIFTADDIDMLNALAAQTSMAVDNAITHEKLLNDALARAAFGRFMPQHVVEQILADPNALSLGGTNQMVTVLFSDIRSFTSMSESLPPEVVVQLLNEYFADMTPIVFEHQGLLDKYIGDGMMALFGVPYPSEDSPANAISAAIAMQRRMVTLNKELHQAGLPQVAIGIGINTGVVTVGYIGSEQHTDYTAIGDAVNLSARLEKQAGPWQILISRSTLEAVGDRFPVKPFGELMVKGKSLPVEVFEVLWYE